MVRLLLVISLSIQLAKLREKDVSVPADNVVNVPVPRSQVEKYCSCTASIRFTTFIRPSCGLYLSPPVYSHIFYCILLVLKSIIITSLRIPCRHPLIGDAKLYVKVHKTMKILWKLHFFLTYKVLI